MIARWFTAGEAKAQPRHRAVSAVKFGGTVRMIEASSKHPIYNWKAAIRHDSAKAMLGRPPVQHAVRLELLFLMARPKRLRGAKHADSVILHTSRPDLDNLEKAIKDACNAIVWLDDSQVSTVWKRKRYTVRNESPGVVVSVSEDLPEGEVPLWP